MKFDLRIYLSLLSKSCFMVICAVILSGCVSGGLVELPSFGSDKAYETLQEGTFSGNWQGRLDRSAGSDRCTVSELGLRFEIDGSDISGKVKRDDRSYFMNGEVTPDGTIINLSIGGYFDKEILFLSGQFNEYSISGTWQSDFCSGIWRADRVG